MTCAEFIGLQVSKDWRLVDTIKEAFNHEMKTLLSRANHCCGKAA